MHTPRRESGSRQDARTPGRLTHTQRRTIGSRGDAEARRGLRVALRGDDPACVSTIGDGELLARIGREVLALHAGIEAQSLSSA